jgi:hypothetical protein
LSAIQKLGTQISTANVLSCSFGKEDGRSILYTVISGDPAQFIVVDVESSNVRKVLEMPGAHGAWAVTTADDGKVYAGTYDNGNLYCYTPGNESFVNLSNPPGERFIWDLKSGTNGLVFMGTYPNGKLFAYDPADENFRDYGPMAAGEQYVRSIAYDRLNERVYAGVGAHARLVEVELGSGLSRNMLPMDYEGNEWVYDVDLAGRKLFARIKPSGDMLVFDVDTYELECVLHNIDSLGVSPLSPCGNKVFYTSSNLLHMYDLQTREFQSLGVEIEDTAVGFGFVELGENRHGMLAVWTRKGCLIKYSINSGDTQILTPALPEMPVSIRSMLCGPDGIIYTSGFLSGGLGMYNPQTQASRQFKTLGQAEGMTAVGRSLYFGVYPDAKIYSFDCSKEEPHFQLLFQLDSYGQDRPYAMLGIEKENKLIVGTVSKYGKLGGALAVYDISMSGLQVYEKVVNNQSIISLAYSNRHVYGGSSIWGGLGSVPTEREAKLFIWDIEFGRKVKEWVPVHGKKAITALIEGPDGMIWGVAEDTLFIVDPASREVVYQEKKFEADYTDAVQVWEGATLIFGNDSYLYGTFLGQFFQIDPISKELIVLCDEHSHLLAKDPSGNFYFAHQSDLFKFSVS